MRSALLLALTLAVTPCLATDQPVVRDKMIVIPVESGATQQQLGSVIKRSDAPPVDVRPFGSGVIVKQPGKPDVVCSPLGSRTVCR